MKIAISYTPAEEHTATAALAAIRSVIPGSRVKSIDRDETTKRLYVTTKRPKTP